MVLASRKSPDIWEANTRCSGYGAVSVHLAVFSSLSSKNNSIKAEHWPPIYHRTALEANTNVQTTRNRDVSQAFQHPKIIACAPKDKTKSHQDKPGQWARPPRLIQQHSRAKLPGRMGEEAQYPVSAMVKCHAI